MSYGLKYYCEFTSISGEQHLIEIRDKDKGDDSGAIALTALPSTFISEYPNFKIGIDTIRGRGSTLSVEYKGNVDDLRALYTTDIKQYKVIQFIDDVVKYVGYLDSEIYEEDFSKSPENGVDIELISHNGFSLLERIPLFEDVFNTGLVSLKDVLFTCINKIELPYNNLYFASDTVSVDEDITHVLNDILINYSNFVDEDGESLNCKDVVEAILKIFQLSMIEIDANIYIFDNETFLKSTITYNVYDIATSTQLADVVVSNDSYSVEELEDILPSTTLVNDAVINNQKVIADNYIVNDIFNASLEPTENYSGTETTTEHNSFGLEDNWTEYRYTEHANFNRVLNNAYFKYVEEGEQKKLDYFISLENNGSNYEYNNPAHVIAKTFPRNYIVGLSKIKLSFKYMFRIIDDYLSDNDNDTFKDAMFYFRLKIGNHWYRGNSDYETGYWVNENTITDETIVYFQAVDYEYTSGEMPYNQWNDFKGVETGYIASGRSDDGIIIDIPSSVHGNVEFYVLADIRYKPDGTQVKFNTGEFRIKDINLETIDANAQYEGEDLANTDNEYEGIGDTKAKSKGDDIKCIINSGYHPFDEFNNVGVPNLSQLFYQSLGTYFGVKYFKRGVNNGGDKILEELLLSSVIGNYEGKNEIIKLTCNYNNIDIIKPFITAYVNNNASKFMIIGCSIDYHMNTIEMNLRKINPDTQL